MKKLSIDVNSDLGNYLLSNVKITKNFYVVTGSVLDESAGITVYDKTGKKLGRSGTWWMDDIAITNKLRETHNFTDDEIKEILKS